MKEYLGHNHINRKISLPIFVVFGLSVFLKLNSAIPPNSYLRINELMASNYSTISDEYGEFDDWIELYNSGNDTINLKGLYITDNRNELFKWNIQKDSLIFPYSHILIWADDQPYQGDFHMNFKLSSEGECLYLIGLNGTTKLDSVFFNKQQSDVSLGIKNDSLNKIYFQDPTPGGKNGNTGFSGILYEPIVSKTGGFYNESFVVSLFAFEPGTKIYYTLDCKEPDNNSAEYTSPITINKTSVLRVKSYKEGYIPSKVVTHSYFFSEESSLDIISLVTDSLNLYGTTGIFKYPHNDLEKPAHFEYYTGNKVLKYANDAGIKIHSSKVFSQYSLRLNAKSIYGDSKFNYKFFENKNYDSYNALILRNGGNDGLITYPNERTHFRDPFMHILFRKINPEINFSSDYKPVNVYLNKNYFGIYDLRERLDQSYIEDNFNYTGEMDFLEWAFDYPGNKYAIEGSWELYDSLQGFAIKNDLNVPANYNYISDNVDIDNFTNYWIFEIYVGNFDWLCNNMKMWRPDIPGGKFKWFLWDVDHGYGLPYRVYGNVNWNTLDWATSTYEGRPGQGVSTQLIRGLLNNENYKYYFINRFADLLNVYLLPENVISVIDSIYLKLYPEIDRQIERWGKSTFYSWIDAVNTLREYARQRPDYVRQHILNEFNLNGIFSLEVDVTPAFSGCIEVNTLKENEISMPWHGVYFNNVPVHVKALPKPGYKFVRWKNTGDTIPEIEFTSEKDTSFLAIFEPLEIDSNRIVINEINYKSHNDYDAGDWVEVLNNTGLKMDLSGWKLQNANGGNYIFPTGLYLNQNEFIVLCADMIKFKSVHPQVKNTIGNLAFTLSGSGDTLYLKNNRNEFIDSVFYDDKKPWTYLPDGNGFTLELKNPFLDNAFSQHWKSSILLNGTPGKANTKILQSAHGLFINEFMAENVYAVYDDFYEYDDWIEIYNSRDYAIDLGGLFITDNLSNKIKHQIPLDDPELTTIEPKGFMLLWADDQVNQGNNHLSFKLDKSEESIGLVQNTGYELNWIDSINYINQSSNSSFGRYIDGVSNWNYLDATPDFNNSMITNINITNLNNVNEIILYPNPSDGRFYIRTIHYGSSYNYEVLNQLGQLILSDNNINIESPYLIDISNQKKGIYLIRIWNNDTKDIAVLKLVVK